MSVVIPVYNEADQVEHNLALIRAQVLRTGQESEIIVVDDGSNDNTWSALQNATLKLPELSCIRLSRNFGKESAICAGLTSANGAACIVMDSDLQHPPELIPEMVRLWKEEHYDVVEGVKLTRGREPLANKVGAQLFYRMLSQLSGYDLHGASDFKLLDRRVVEAWKQMDERNTFFRGMVTWLGYRRKRIPFSVAPRSASASRWSLVSLFRLAAIAITAFSSLPLQIVTILGFVFLLCSVFLAAQALHMYFSGSALPGFTTVILLELIVGGVLMISLGIIGTYLARLYDEAKARPRFIIADYSRHDDRDVQSTSSPGG